MNSKIISLAVASVLSLGASAAQADVTNGGFETGDFSGWTVTGGDSRLTAFPFVFVGNTSSAYNGGNPNTPNSGSYAAQLGYPGLEAVPYGYPATRDVVLSQTVITTPGQIYEFSFSFINPALSGWSPDGEFSASWNGTDLFSYSSLINPLGPTTWKEFEYNVAGTGSDVVSFTSYNWPTAYGLDDVYVGAVAADPVPEPNSLFLMGIGSLGMVGMLRWKKNVIIKMVG